MKLSAHSCGLSLHLRLAVSSPLTASLCVFVGIENARYCGSMIMPAGVICRLAEEEIVKHIITTDASISRLEALQMFRSWYGPLVMLPDNCTSARKSRLPGTIRIIWTNCASAAQLLLNLIG